MESTSAKRKNPADDETERSKRVKGASGAAKKPQTKHRHPKTGEGSKPSPQSEGSSGGGDPAPADVSTDAQVTKESPAESLKARPNIRKLVPPRPFPTVPTSVSATGPRSAHKEGKNYICVTRKTKLGAYLRRCKALFIEDGYKSLHMSAMGAAIPHLATLAVSLPPILPFPADEIHTEIKTGSVDVHDEVIPDDEDEDIEYRTRIKSTLSVVIKVGEGDDAGQVSTQKGSAGEGKKKKRKRSKGSRAAASEDTAAQPGGAEQIVLQEPEQEMDVS